MKTLAAVLVETRKPLELVELEIPPLRAGQVLVEIEYSGVCQTQVGEWLGVRGADPFLPHCLGHEGSGRVIDVGADVSRVRPGNAVILSWLKGPGRDVPGTVYRWGNRDVNAGGVTTFSRHSVVSENRVSLAPTNIPPRVAALVGCAVATGFGSITNTANVAQGESVVIFGVGGIGLCALMAAKICGASSITAVDTNQARLALAARLGATHSIDAATSDVQKSLAAIVPGGFDVAVEASGKPAVMQLALSAVRRQGGRTVVVGNAPFGEMLSIDPRELNQGKRLLGTWGGDTKPERDFSRYCQWIVTGKAPVELLIDREYPLSDINLAVDDLRFGRCTRPIIQMNSEETTHLH